MSGNESGGGAPVADARRCQDRLCKMDGERGLDISRGWEELLGIDGSFLLSPCASIFQFSANIRVILVVVSSLPILISIHTQVGSIYMHREREREPGGSFLVDPNRFDLSRASVD